MTRVSKVEARGPPRAWTGWLVSSQWCSRNRARVQRPSICGCRIGYLVASLGIAIRLNRARLSHLRPKTESRCPFGLRLGLDDLSLLHFQHYSAHHDGNCAHGGSVFSEALNDASNGPTNGSSDSVASESLEP